MSSVADESAFHLLALPPDVQLLCAQSADPTTKKAMFAVSHSLRLLVLASTPQVVLSTWHDAPLSIPQQHRAARLLQSHEPVPKLRIIRNGNPPSFLPSLLDAVSACNCQALEIWNEDITAGAVADVTVACTQLTSLTVDLSGTNSVAGGALVCELSGLTQITRLELLYGANADEIFEPLASSGCLPGLQQLAVHYMEGFLPSEGFLRRLTDLSVSQSPCSEEEFPVACSPWVTHLLAQPQQFQRLDRLELNGSLPWSGLKSLLALPALKKLQARQLLPPSDGGGGLHLPVRLAELLVVQLSVNVVCLMPHFLKQIPALRISRLLLPEVAPGGEADAVQQVHQAAAILGSMPVVTGMDLNNTSAFRNCIEIAGTGSLAASLGTWLAWSQALTPLAEGVSADATRSPERAGPAAALLPMAHHLGAVSFAESAVEDLLAAADSLSEVLRQTVTLNIGRCIASAEELWVLVQALPRLRTLCFNLRPEMEQPLKGLISSCEAAQRRLVLQAVGYARRAKLEAAVAALSASCAGHVEVELRHL